MANSASRWYACSPVCLSPTTVFPHSDGTFYVDRRLVLRDESGFKIEHCQGGKCSNFTQFAQVGQNTNSFSATGLSKNASYSFRVSAYNDAGNSAYSNTATARTLKR
jgi:hypothetical protein